MKFFFTIISFLLIGSFPSSAQQGFSWLKCIGGTGQDLFSDNVITRSGTIISVGTSESNDGDCSGNHGTEDVLITAMNSSGAILWTKLVGGSNWDGVNGTDIDTLTDGNIIVAFNSASTDGDISGNHGVTDFIFRKYSVAGNLIWTKTYGGTGAEDLDEVKATPDGGFIAIGTTNSNNTGDVGPNHGTNSYDVWIIKLDASGNIQWQKCYGGSLDEEGATITLASGGGYYFASGTKSTDGDLSGLLPNGTPIGSSDIWFAKINSTGTLLWSKEIGGSDTDDFPVVYETGSSVYLTFESKSSDRDIFFNSGIFDVSLFKYSSSGTLVWKEVYGSTSWDAPSAIISNNDGNLYITAVCYSTSFSGFPIYNPGDGQALLLRVDTVNAALRWVRSYGGSQRDFAADMKIATNGDIIISGSTISNDYDISGNHGDYDGLVFRVTPSNRIKGNVFIDRNNNNTYDAGIDQRVSYLPVEASKQNIVQATTISNDGNYLLEVDTGNFVTRAKPYHPTYFTIIPDTFQCSFSAAYQAFNRNIQVKPVNGIRDLRVYTIPVTQARPNFAIRYMLIGYNVGTDTVSSGTISWKKDPRVTITNISTPPNSVIGDSLTWNFSSFKPFDSIRIFIDIRTPVPPAINPGDTMKYVARILPVAGDVYQTDNTLFLYHMVLGPLDPNEKINLNANKMNLAEVQAGSYINYVIHFQNVGTASAFDVIVKDTMSNKLQLSTLEPVASSHPFQMEIKGNTVTWKFININLPDSTSNEPGSHGFIAFRIKPLVTLPAGDSVTNKAAIFFDYNSAVLTNNNAVKIVNNDIITGLPNQPPDDKTVVVFPNPLSGQNLHITNKVNGRRFISWQLYNSMGEKIDAGQISTQSLSFDISIHKKFQNGLYYLELQTINKVLYKQIMILR